MPQLFKVKEYPLRKPGLYQVTITNATCTERNVWGTKDKEGAVSLEMTNDANESEKFFKTVGVEYSSRSALAKVMKCIGLTKDDVPNMDLDTFIGKKLQILVGLKDMEDGTKSNTIEDIYATKYDPFADDNQETK